MNQFTRRIRLNYLCFGLCLIAASAFCVSSDAFGRDPNWSQWRGSEGNGVSTEKNLPTEWSATKNIKWKTPITGRGHSSPIIWGRKIFLTTAIEGAVVPGAKAPKHVIQGEEFFHPDSVGADRRHTFKVLCLDRDTGKLLWEQTAYEGTVYDNRHRKASYASATPATDGKHVFAFFGSEGLYCYDANGKLVWKASIGQIGSLGVGTSSSPVIYENLVIVQCDDENPDESFIVAFDKKTGKEAWKVARKVQLSWSTPLLVHTAKRTELIASGAEAVISYDPKTGKELWRHKGLESNAVPSPVATDDTVFLASGYPTKIALAIRLGGTGDLTGTPNVIWKYAKGTAYVPSPIVYGGLTYFMTDRGILTCLDAKTGAVKYEGGRVPVPATFTASPIAYDGKILLMSEDGDTFVLQAGATHSVLRTNSLGEPIYASPAIADGKLFIRGEKHLYCIAKA